MLFGPQAAESLFLQSPTGAREGYKTYFVAREAAVNDGLGQFVDLDYRVRHGGKVGLGAKRIKVATRGFTWCVQC